MLDVECVVMEGSHWCKRVRVEGREGGGWLGLSPSVSCITCVRMSVCVCVQGFTHKFTHR